MTSHMKRLAFDIEGNGPREVTINKKKEAWLEVTEVHCICTKDIDTGEARRYVSNPAAVEESDGTIAEGFTYLMSADLLIAHNGTDYDYPVLFRLVVPSWFDRRDAPKLVDTAIWSRFLYPDRTMHPNTKLGRYPNSLEAWGKRLKKLKGEFTGSWERLTQEMLDYCVQDVEVLAALYAYLLPKIKKWPVHSRLEHELSRAISDQVENGVSFDIEAGHEFWDLLTSEQARLLDAIRAVFPPRIETMKTPCYWEVWDTIDGGLMRFPTKGECQSEARKAGWKPKTTSYKAGPLRTKEIPFNPGSDDQVAERLIEMYGWEPVDFTDGGKPSCKAEILAKLDYPGVLLINEWNLIDDRLSILKDWIKRAETSRDGRIHAGYITIGTPTHRFTHSQPNITAVTKVLVGDDGPVSGYAGRYGLESRSLFGPRPGWAQIGADADSLELRMLANRTMPFDGGAYAKIIIDGDVHTHNLNAIPILQTRDQAKEVFYAGIYGAGHWKQGHTILNHKSLSREQLLRYGSRSPEQVGRTFKDQLAESVPALFKASERCKRLVESQGYLVALDGRRGPSRSEHSALNLQLQMDGSVICRLAFVLFIRWATAKYGPPSLGIGLPGRWAMLINAHDEMQAESESKIAKEIGEYMAWCYGEAGRRLKCKIETPGNYKIGANWAECH